MLNAVTLTRRTIVLASLALLTAPATAAAGFVSRRIAVAVRGSGSDVLLLPGLAAGTSVWNRTVAAVPGFRFHQIGVRGFAGLAAEGNATAGTGANGSPALLDAVADEIARYIAANGLKRPAIIGHSMGGTLAMLVALRHPGRVGRIMVVDMLPAGAAMIGGTSQGAGFLANQLYGYFMGTEAGRRMFSQLLKDAAPGSPPSDPAVVAQALRELAEIDLTRRLQRLGAPLTVVYAMPADPKLRSSQAQRYRTAYRGVTGAVLVPIGPSGHMVMDDQPTAFTAAVRTFLR